MADFIADGIFSKFVNKADNTMLVLLWRAGIWI
jgi:hypothetical protein